MFDCVDQLFRAHREDAMTSPQPIGSYSLDDRYVRTAGAVHLTGVQALVPAFRDGTSDELCERLLERRERWGFTNIVVPAEAMESFAPVVTRGCWYFRWR